MRTPRSGLAGLAAVAALAVVLLSGCELREGDKREYGESGPSSELGRITHSNVDWLNTRQF
jgi:hypothetical protein